MIIYLNLTLTPVYDSYGISTDENSKGYDFFSYNSPGTSSSRTAQKHLKEKIDQQNMLKQEYKM